MRLSCLLPFVALLAGCPTPPEAGPQGGNQPNNPGGGPEANGGPGGPGGNNGGPGNNGPGGPPPEGGGENGPGGPPPEGGGENGPSGPPPEGGGDNGPGGPPPEGGGGGGDGAAQGAPDGRPTPPDVSAPPVPEAGDPIQGSLLLQVLNDDRLDPGGMKPQHEITSGDHVTFSGTATCNGCSESLVLRAMPFLSPDQLQDTKIQYTTVTLSAPGAFSIAVPKGSEAMALELLVDADGDGRATKGERFAILEMGGKLIPDQDRTGLTMDASDRDFDAAMPVNREGLQAGEAGNGGQGG